MQSITRLLSFGRVPRRACLIAQLKRPGLFYAAIDCDGIVTACLKSVL